jgi:hypothetical protein
MLNWLKRFRQWREIDEINRKPLGWGIEWPMPKEERFSVELKDSDFTEEQVRSLIEEVNKEYDEPNYNFMNLAGWKYD